MVDTLWSLITTPWALQPDTLLGAAVLALLAALLGEVVWRALRWPRMLGYTMAGTVLALTGVGASGQEPALRLAIDAALAMLLFEAGARLNLRWLVRNPWLLASSAAEAVLTAAAVWWVMRSFAVPREAAAPLAIIASAVSPVVLQRVIGELHAAGQVTERLLALAALNTLYAILALQLFSAGLLLSDPRTWLEALSPVLFSFCGSILVGAALGEGLTLISRRLDLRDESALVLVLAAVLLALVVAKTLQLSALLAPLLAGIWLRNRSDRPWVWPRHFGSAGSVLVMVMFVAVGSAWHLQALGTTLGLAVALVLTRAAAKSLAVLTLARPSGLGFSQALCLGVGLLPMSGTAWILGLDFAARHPIAGAQVVPVLLTVLGLLELGAPLIVMACLRAAGEIEVQRRAKPP
jgi:Kef-type K+ transport system membrane component KefB